MPLEPDHHMVINQKDCKLLWPQFDDKNMLTSGGKLKQLVNFFDGPEDKDIELYVNGMLKLAVLIRKSGLENVKKK